MSWTVAAFLEEMVYRGWLMTRLAELGLFSTRGWAASALASSALFGAAHLYQGASGVMATGLSGLVSLSVPGERAQPLGLYPGSRRSGYGGVPVDLFRCLSRSVGARPDRRQVKNAPEGGRPSVGESRGVQQFLSIRTRPTIAGPGMDPTSAGQFVASQRGRRPGGQAPGGTPSRNSSFMLRDWKYAAWRRLTGRRRGSFPLKGSNWFPRQRNTTEQAWRADVALLDRMNRLLREAVAQFEGSDLSRAPGGSPVTNGFILSGVAAHARSCRSD